MEITVNIRNFAYGNKVKDVVSVVQLCALAPLWEHDPNQLSFIRNGVEMTPGERPFRNECVKSLIMLSYTM